MEKQIENMKKYNVPVVVAINKFVTDSNEEIQFIKDFCEKLEVKVALSDVGQSERRNGCFYLSKLVSDGAHVQVGVSVQEILYGQVRRCHDILATAFLFNFKSVGVHKF